MGYGEIKERIPLIEELLNQWTKKASVKKADTFSKQQAMKYLTDVVDDEKTMVIKAYFSIGIHEAGRKCETTHLNFEDIRVLMPNDPRNESGYQHGPIIEIEFDRRKNTGSKVRASCYIKDPIWVRPITNYISLFPTKDRTGRFFRKLQSKNNIVVVPTKQVIGKNTSATFPYKIALALQIPEVEATYIFIFYLK